MESTNEKGENSLLKTQVTRRTTLTAAAWSAPVIAVAAATPAAVASPFEVADLAVAALGGAEGRYSTGGDFTNGVVGPNTDFRRAFSVTNNGTGTFTGTLKIDFQFPRIWNQGIGSGSNTDAFQGYSTVDLGWRNGGFIGGKTGWTVTQGGWEENYGNEAWGAVHQRMDDATFNLTGVQLPPKGVIWFALNATIPFSWIGSAGPPPEYLDGGRIYWRSEVYVTAIPTVGDSQGPYPMGVGDWANGIWYFNGGGPFAYHGGEGLYPDYGTA